MADVSDVEKYVEIIFYANTILISWLGYLVWRKQLTGKRDHDLAKSLLVGIYEYKQVIDYLRSSENLLKKVPTLADEVNGENILEELHRRELNRYNRVSKIYGERFEKLNRVKSNLQPLLVESRAIFNDNIQKFYDQMLQIEFKIAFEISNYQLYITAGSRKAFFTADEEPNYEVIFSNGTSKDLINMELNNIIKNIEKFLDPKLFKEKWYQKLPFTCK